MTEIEFSVLLPVYIGDRADDFERALRSVTYDQTLRPSQVVVVCDGPVRSEIADLLQTAEVGDSGGRWGGVPVDVVRIDVNGGLSNALNRGLEKCSYDIVARADADDISLPERFATQLPYLERGYGLVGSSITEFEHDEHVTGLVRIMPMSTKEIRHTLALRDPFNHPTVVYRASGVRRAGGYEHVDHMEDYWLFARMMAQGVQAFNVRDPLVLYRVGDGAYDRRGGPNMLRSEVTLQRLLLNAGITSPIQFLRNVLLRGGYRLVPSSFRRVAYRTAGRLRWFRVSGTGRSAV